MSSTELEVREEAQELAPATLFRTDQPAEIIARATDTANALMGAVRKQKLTANIQGKEYPLVEAWTLCGTMLGVFPVCVWTRKLEDGWEARVEARTLAGQVVGAAEAQCTRTERTWKTRDEYALRSMAQTRATSKALRQPLGFVMTLAGLQATPAEEIPRDGLIEDAILDPDGSPFPDQRESGESQFKPPAGATDAADDRTPKAGGATKAQLGLIHVLIDKCGKRGITEDTLRDQLELQHGTRHFSELPRAVVSGVIDSLKVTAGE